MKRHFFGSPLSIFTVGSFLVIYGILIMALELSGWFLYLFVALG